jgi:hypothetical protein
MNSRYRLINDCLQVLRQCDLASRQKLRLEVELFQVKLLLLSDEVSGDVKARYCSEVVLQELYQEIKELSGSGVSGSGVSGVAVEAVSRRLKQVTVDIGREAAGR